MGVRDLINGKKPDDFLDWCAAAFLSVSRPLYAAGVFFHRQMYYSGIKKIQKLPCRVICIGNLTVGGSGKTPITIMAARLLIGRGKRVAILSRGYKRKDTEEDVVLVRDERQILSDPRECGDEPYLMARYLNRVPVVVCSDRFKGGNFLIERFDPEIILMDDGFQHWPLKRDCDIVCLDSQRPLKKLRLLPRGPLREFPSALNRAQALVFTHTGGAGDLPAQEEYARKFAPTAPVFHIRFELGSIMPVNKKDLLGIPSHELKQKKALVFCGIANPDSFFDHAKKVLSRVRKTLAFPDHVHYDADHIRTLRSEFTYSEADVAFTTEKDAVKLQSAKLPRMPFFYFPLKTVFEGENDEARFLSLLLEAEK